MGEDGVFAIFRVVDELELQRLGVYQPHDETTGRVFKLANFVRKTKRKADRGVAVEVIQFLIVYQAEILRRLRGAGVENSGG
jgi:hypothetical protein